VYIDNRKETDMEVKSRGHTFKILVVLALVVLTNTDVGAFGRNRLYGAEPLSDWNTRHGYLTTDRLRGEVKIAILQWALDHGTFPGDTRIFDHSTHHTTIGTAISCVATGAGVAVDGPGAGKNADIDAVNSGDVAATCTVGDGTTFTVNRTGTPGGDPPPGSPGGPGGGSGGHKPKNKRPGVGYK
jgi:hypothetical protein